MKQNKKPDPENLPPSMEPPKMDPDKREERENDLFKHSDKNEPNPAGNKDVKPEDQNSG